MNIQDKIYVLCCKQKRICIVVELNIQDEHWNIQGAGSKRLLITRASRDIYEVIRIKGAKYYLESRIIEVGSVAEK